MCIQSPYWECVRGLGVYLQERHLCQKWFASPIDWGLSYKKGICPLGAKSFVFIGSKLSLLAVHLLYEEIWVQKDKHCVSFETYRVHSS